MNRFINRRWIFLDSNDLDKVNFEELPLVNQNENKPTSVRYSRDRNKFMIRYEVSEISGSVFGRPSCYDFALNIDGKIEWQHEDVLEYLKTDEWINNDKFPN